MENEFEAKLDAMARRRLGGSVCGLKRLTGGASQELWSFDAADRGYVLRRQPALDRMDREGLASLEEEAAAIRAVGARGVPVPAVAWVLEPDDGLGRGFVASRMPGEALGKKVVGSAAFEAIRSRLAGDCGRILAAIHTTPPDELPGLATRTPESTLDAFERQLRSSDEPRPVFEGALAWLRRYCPASTPACLVHGDFRTGNFLLTPGGISAVLDWEGCHLGDPMADLGWLCMPIWRFGRLDRPVGGFGEREQLFESYAVSSGQAVEPDRVRFWEIVGMMRWGLTCAAMAAAFERGERSIERAAVGRRGSEAELELLRAIVPELA